MFFLRIGNTAFGENMLDQRTSILLEKINELCAGGGFKIAEEGELLSCFPSYLKTDKEELSRILRYLEERRYIDVKYAEEGVYCLCPLPEGRLYFENAREKRYEGARRRREMFFVTALGAFLGGFLGTLVVYMISLFVR